MAGPHREVLDQGHCLVSEEAETDIHWSANAVL